MNPWTVGLSRFEEMLYLDSSRLNPWAHPSCFADRQVWPELFGLEGQSTSRNHTWGGGKHTGMAEERIRNLSHPFSKFGAYSLVCFTGPKAEHPPVLNSSPVLPLQQDQYECQQLGD